VGRLDRKISLFEGGNRVFSHRRISNDGYF
jgi:hypothetical protein